ncbi:RNA polymerase sigma factor [Adhaeretor mobilis]|uniref:RNA polymerase sigma factor CnrH n=1 Tax=Adhaeretor mobilis TaxID=1930276 RepID=A0A517MV62_9BACT|nr:sigma-70 family RNA polymerase sigma factor [Adhaeretor mobilis]QDS98773.1 RNA polymerase sigma factor CnrH [Adhaeretor mobilis]
MKRPFVNLSEGTSSSTSSEMLRQAQAHDQDAWKRLVELYSRRMYRWCRRSGLQPADAANVVQDAFGAVARKLVDFRRDRPSDTFRGWLRRIIENKIRDHYRVSSRTNDQAVGGTTNGQLLEQMVDSDAFQDEATWDTSLVQQGNLETGPVAAAAAKVRNEVSTRDWRFFWRVAVDGQSAADVAREFGVTANTVRIVKMRVLRRLRKHLSNHPSAES